MQQASIKYGVKNYTISWSYKSVFSTWREVYSLHDRKAVISNTNSTFDSNIKNLEFYKKENFKPFELFLMYHCIELNRTMFGLVDLTSIDDA